MKNRKYAYRGLAVTLIGVVMCLIGYNDIYGYRAPLWFFWTGFVVCMIGAAFGFYGSWYGDE